MIIKRFVSSFILFISIVSLMISQIEDGEFSALKSPEGVMIVYNNPGAAFSIDIKCRSMKEIEKEQMIFIFDGKVLQFTPVPIFVFYPDAPANPPDSLVLLKHRINEMDYIRQLINKDVTPQSDNFLTKSGKLCYFWEFDIPGLADDTLSTRVIKQMYLTTRINNRVLMISSAVMRMNNRDELRKFIKGIAETIKISSKSFDLNKIKDSLEVKK